MTDLQIKHAKYLRSKEWAEIRYDLLELRGYKCEICGSKAKLQIHHLTYENWGNEEPDDLIILCGYHHCLEHGLVKKRRRRRKHKPLQLNKFVPDAEFLCVVYETMSRVDGAKLIRSKMNPRLSTNWSKRRSAKYVRKYLIKWAGRLGFDTCKSIWGADIPRDVKVKKRNPRPGKIILRKAANIKSGSGIKPGAVMLCRECERKRKISDLGQRHPSPGVFFDIFK